MTGDLATARRLPDAADRAAVDAAVATLRRKLEAYLRPGEVDRVMMAFRRADAAHAGQSRRTGEPYITHPLSVAAILGDMRLDAEAVMAALLHDTLEDTALTRDELAETFGEEVAELVDGVTKLDKLNFGSRAEASAESFRKMLLAMSRDLRVILIKLADRLHNMRTLDAMDAESRRRVARETLEIYSPIAHRLGMNAVRTELADLGFAALHPWRHRVLRARLGTMYGNRRVHMTEIEETLAARLAQEGIPARVIGRVKSPYSTYRKMRSEHKALEQLMDVYGMRVIVADVVQCYMALGALHGLYKPLDQRFRDFIAIPKANGYQSLHTTLFGPGGSPLEVQIRTEDMHMLAERGVAAHWSYKTGDSPANASQARAAHWLAGLLDSQSTSTSSLEFVENVKIDLFPDEVYLFTPKGDILALPRNATALDFAYAVHTQIGNHAVAARVDRKLVPLRTRLASGQAVEIITAPSVVPNPNWLEFVVTSKARTAIRHHFKKLQHEDAVQLGHRMLDRALAQSGHALESIGPDVLDRFLADNKLRRLEELLEDLALGQRMPQQVAQQLLLDAEAPVSSEAPRVSEQILISGRERGVFNFAKCCYPVPGDEIMGYLSAGKGVVVHREECPNVPEFRKQSERCVEMGWERKVEGEFRTLLRAIVDNKPGVLAQVAAAIAEADSNIENVEYQERDASSAALLFTIEVRDTRHLAEVRRRMQRAAVVHAVNRFMG